MGKIKSLHKGFKSPETEKFSDEVVEMGKTASKQIFGDGFLNGLLYGQNSESSPAAQSGEFEVTDPGTGGKVIFDAANNHHKTEPKQHHVEKSPKPKIEAAINYHTEFIKNSERVSQQERHEISQKLQEIMNELQRLVSTSKVLQMEFEDVSVQQTPKDAGDYHLNFFDWLLLTIRAARQKVEDSGAWLATAKSKTGKKGGYWDMFKKHGTSFGLSNERNVATQTG